MSTTHTHMITDHPIIQSLQCSKPTLMPTVHFRKLDVLQTSRVSTCDCQGLYHAASLVTCRPCCRLRSPEGILITRVCPYQSVKRRPRKPLGCSWAQLFMAFDEGDAVFRFSSIRNPSMYFKHEISILIPLQDGPALVTLSPLDLHRSLEGYVYVETRVLMRSQCGLSDRFC